MDSALLFAILWAIDVSDRILIMQVLPQRVSKRDDTLDKDLPKPLKIFVVIRRINQ